MKMKLIALTAALAAAASLNAHCGSCSMDGSDKHDHAESCSQGQMDPYFETQAALAGDDLPAAQAAAKAYLDMAEEKGCNLESESCCAAEIGAAEKIAGASDIAAARASFKTWSDNLIAKLDENGLAEGDAFKMYCPMAFNNQGGAWLQASKDLKNPYYGSMMLSCGMTQKHYGTGSASEHAAPAAEHAHSH